MNQTWPEGRIPQTEEGHALLAVRCIDIFCKSVFRGPDDEAVGLPSFPQRDPLPQKITERLPAFMDKLPGVPAEAQRMAADPTSPLFRAASALQNGRLEAAREILRRSVTEYGASLPAWAGDMSLRLRLEAHRLAGDRVAATRDAHHLCLRYPQLKFLRIDLAWLLEDQGLTWEAQAALDEVGLTDEEEWSSMTAGELTCGLLLSGRIHLSRMHCSAAEADFSLAAAVAGCKRPALRANAEFQRSRAALLAGFPLTALQAVKRAIADTPAPVPAAMLFFRGHLRWHLGDLRGARSDLEAAVTLDPGQSAWRQMLNLLMEEIATTGRSDSLNPVWLQDRDSSLEPVSTSRIDSDGAAPYITHTAAAELFRWRLTDDPIHPGATG